MPGERAGRGNLGGLGVRRGDVLGGGAMPRRVSVLQLSSGTASSAGKTHGAQAGSSSSREARTGCWDRVHTDVVKILAREREIYQYHLGADPSQVPTSLFQQALRQDPELYALAVACSEDKNTQLLATPFPGEGGIVAEVIL